MQRTLRVWVQTAERRQIFKPTSTGLAYLTIFALTFVIARLQKLSLFLSYLLGDAKGKMINLTSKNGTNARGINLWFVAN